MIPIPAALFPILDMVVRLEYRLCLSLGLILFLGKIALHKDELSDFDKVSLIFGAQQIAACFPQEVPDEMVYKLRFHALIFLLFLLLPLRL